MSNSVCGFAVLISACSLFATSEITSNEVFRLAGGNDTLWMITAKGINFTVATSDSLSWWGYKSEDMVWGNNYASLTFGDSKVFVPLVPENLATPNTIWTYDLNTQQASNINPPWNVQRLNALQDSLDSLEVYIQAYDIFYTPGKLWIARWYGGLLEWDLATGTGTVHNPGDSISYAAAVFPPMGLADYPDSNNAVASVTATGEGDSTLIWVLTPGRIWTFDPALSDSSWDTVSRAIDDSNRVVKEFVGFYVKERENQIVLFSDIMTAPKSGDTTSLISMYRYNFISMTWDQFLPESPDALTFGFGDTLYIVSDNKIYAYKDTLPATIVIPNTDFTTRLTSADEAPPSEIYDVLFVPNQDDTAIFWIASNQGIYYSRNEINDEKHSTNFQHDFRSPNLASGLTQTYFYPSILKPDPFDNSVIKGYFAYNLSENAKVTIKIYDWNMDLVKTVIDKAPRIAGSSRKSGRSTIKDEDSWDGTNLTKEPVAPGVYYYKITTDNGERDFGRIIVAR